MIITNQLLNRSIPFANCPSGSMDDSPQAGWYLDDLHNRLSAAEGIGDELTAAALRQRIRIHEHLRKTGSNEMSDEDWIRFQIVQPARRAVAGS